MARIKKPNIKDLAFNIGQALVELRIRAGYPLMSDFVKAYNLPAIQYWRLENGHCNATLKSLKRLADIHGVTVKDLL